MPLLLHARQRLRDGGVENADAEARWMTELLPRDGHEAARLEEWLDRRIAGEPFQYVVGTAAFYGIDLDVGPGVLIPRPETELLVERALRLLRPRPADTPVLDLCTGSGAIPLAILHERPDLSAIGVDLSPDALTWAERNRRRLRAERCVFLQGDLFGPLPADARFPLVTANPPYVSPREYPDLPPVVKDHEPRLALVAEDDGLALELRIAADARRHLTHDGTLLLEIGETQGPRIADQLRCLGYHDVAILPDLAGKDRIAEAHWSGN